MEQQEENEHKQQTQAKEYFDEGAGEWDEKARGKSQQPKVNVIGQRNEFVLRTVNQRWQTRSALDIGCGVGDLVVELVKLGVDARGLDFAPKMISIAKQRLRQQLMAEERAEVADFFNWQNGPKQYDLIAANGFIEYISPRQRDVFLQRAWQLLSDQGSLVISLRNRLFNIWSLNEYTLQEVKEKEIKSLVCEAVAWANGADLKEMADWPDINWQSGQTKHGYTGIKVDQRWQYTPTQIIKLLARMGFETKNIAAIHIHGSSSGLKERQTELHVRYAKEVQALAWQSTKWLPQGSAFMIHAIKHA